MSTAFCILLIIFGELAAAAVVGLWVLGFFPITTRVEGTVVSVFTCGLTMAFFCAFELDYTVGLIVVSTTLAIWASAVGNVFSDLRGKLSRDNSKIGHTEDHE